MKTFARSLFCISISLFTCIAFAGFCDEKLTRGQSSAHLHQDLATYINSMERGSLQKAAFASLARPGRIADLGTGSGISARDLALLFPDSFVVGVDLDPNMVRHAQNSYKLKNLSYRVGNAEIPPLSSEFPQHGFYVFGNTSSD